MQRLQYLVVAVNVLKSSFFVIVNLLFSHHLRITLSLITELQPTLCVHSHTVHGHCVQCTCMSVFAPVLFLPKLTRVVKLKTVSCNEYTHTHTVLVGASMSATMCTYMYGG